MPRKTAKGVKAGTRTVAKGRHGFRPTDEQRRMVEAMSAFGVRQEDIAACIGKEGINKSTLLKYFRKELDLGGVKAVTQVATGLYGAALKAQRDPRYQTSAIFFLKARGGDAWRQPSRALTIDKPTETGEIKIVLSEDDLAL